MTSQQRAMISPISTPPVRQPFALHRAKAVLGACLMAALVLALPACGRDPSASASDPAPPPAATAPDLSKTYHFESGPVRPLALSADRKRLFVANTAAGTLDILTVDDDGLRAEASVPVGVDPVAVAERHAGEVWVVNHLSDSISVVDVASSPPRVRQTLLVGDEPRDIVFAGPQRQRAFITTAHRGQQRSSPDLAGVPGAGDPQLTTPGVGRADVWVFDTDRLGDTLGGRPVAIVVLPGDTPRALATSVDGGTVYAAVHHSGNRTTAISSHLPCEGFDNDTPCTVNGQTVPGSALGPGTNSAGVPAPAISLIVKADAQGAWRDGRGRDWSSLVRFDLPDDDVFALDAQTLDTTARFAQVGTTLFNMAVNPRSGAVYVSNTEARNELRFEGPGRFTGTTLQGHLAEARITVLGNGKVAPRHLNQHLDYDRRPAPATLRSHSLSTPLDMAVSADGTTLYVAAFGSGKVGVLPTASLADGHLDPVALSASYLSVSGGGPSGLALDEPRGRLYVSTRFDNGVSVIDLGSRRERQHLRLTSPEAPVILDGRRLLYDATHSSSNGEASCASCHVFGHTDQLAWDLGNPDAGVTRLPSSIKFNLAALGSNVNGTGNVGELHPLKGPMLTQTLRGLAYHGPMHWRGDRAVGVFGTDPATEPPFDASLSFMNFIAAFEELLGRAEPLPAADMRAFTDFSLAIAAPPNPIRALDNSLTPAQARGRRFFMGCDGLDTRSGAPVDCGPDQRPRGAGHFSDQAPLPLALPVAGLGFTCEGCHTLSPADGLFGTNGQSAFETLSQTFKIPGLRSLYDRVGMFGVASQPKTLEGDHRHQGPQVRGFGYSHDGSVDTVFRFLQLRIFDTAQGGLVGFAQGDAQRRDVEDYLLAFDADLAPIVGQQITLDERNAGTVAPRIDLLRARALTPFASRLTGGRATECDLVVTGVIDGKAVRFVMAADGRYRRDDGALVLSDEGLRARAKTSGQALTFTCLPPGRAPAVSVVSP
jgi:DNA-binding beta-propeller fold protein YncE